MNDWNMMNTNTNMNMNNGLNYRPNLLPHYEIIRVNGEAGARAFQMGPNSSIFLADSTNSAILWVAQTDGAGYLTVTPFDVSPHQNEQQVKANALEERVNHLEELYGQLAAGLNKQSRKQRKIESSITTD